LFSGNFWRDQRWYGMPTEPDLQDKDQQRRADCLAKAGYCKWAAQMTPDEGLREFYRELSAEWEKEALV
jgi:hypothetical protein